MGSLPSPHPSTVPGSIHFLTRNPLYKEEKPYTIRYSTPDDVPKTNSVHEEIHGISIEDIRGREASFNLSQHGFTIISTHDSNGMTYEDFSDPDKVVNVYLQSVARMLREVLKAAHVQVYEHTIRRRDALYPVSTGKVYEYDQPTNSAHIDVTEEYVQQLRQRINNSLPTSATEGMDEQTVQCINVWKPLRGPLDDWPLCVCDASTVDAERDLVPSDQVFPGHVVENIQVHFDAAQKWYYLSKQRDDELWIFCQSVGRSEGGLRSGAPHCSFYNPKAPSSDFPRESIECRALVYFENSAIKSS